MKTKLLKKIRKRFNWYFNVNGFPVLIDHYYKKVTVYDLEFCMNYNKYSLEDVEAKVKCSHNEWALRHMKQKVFNSIGYNHYDYTSSIYKLAIKRYNKKLVKNKI